MLLVNGNCDAFNIEQTSNTWHLNLSSKTFFTIYPKNFYGIFSLFLIIKRIVAKPKLNKKKCSLNLNTYRKDIIYEFKCKIWNR